MRVILFFIVFTAIQSFGFANLRGDTTQVEDEEFSYKSRDLVGVGMWTGAASGSGASVRFNPGGKNFILQLTGYYYSMDTTQSSSIGVAGIVPLYSDHRSRYYAMMAVANYVDSGLKSRNRIGASLGAEWMAWNRLSLNITIDVFTWFDDGTKISPLASAGIYVYI